MRRLRLLLALVVCLFPGLTAAPATAGDLVDLFPGLIQEASVGLTPVVTIVGGPEPGTYFADPGEFVIGNFDPTAGVANLSGQIAGQFQRFPVGSTVAAFTFEFDPELNVFTRSTEGLGPLLSERAQTTGKGKINFAMGYSRVEFNVFEGDPLDRVDVGFGGSQPFEVLGGSEAADSTATYASGGGLVDFKIDFPTNTYTFQPVAPGSNSFDTPELVGVHTATFDQGSVSFPVRSSLDAQLDVDVIAFFLNYGVTDWLDVGIVVPLLNIDAAGQVTTVGATDTSGNPVLLQTRKARDDDFGFGDLIARVKARALQTEYVDLAVRADLVIPTGDEDQLRGYGDPAFGGTVILSKTFGIVSPHANAGLQFRTDDPDQHVFRWAAGLDIQPWDVLTFVVDGIGEHHLNRGVDVGDDIFAVSAGLKVNPWSRLVVAGNAVVRLNDRGLRADVIPSVTVEYTFR